MNKHTPEPWEVDSMMVVGPRSEADDQTFGMIIGLADIYGDNEKADATRIVACVNALAGIDDPEAFMQDVRGFFSGERPDHTLLDGILEHLKGSE